MESGLLLRCYSRACDDDLHVPDEEAAVEDQDSLIDECHTSRTRRECFFAPGVPRLDHERCIAPLIPPQAEEADLQDEGMSQETKGEAPRVVEYARVDGDDGHWVCAIAGSGAWGVSGSEYSTWNMLADHRG